MFNSNNSSCAKFILFGEHSILHKGCALSIPLPELRLSIESIEESNTIYFNGLAQHDEKRDMLNELASRMNIHIPNNLGLNVVSQIPIGSGLGSSAALCCSLVKAFSSNTLSNDELAQTALQGENYFHGNSSGLDPFTIANETPIAFEAQNHKYYEFKLNALRENNLGFFIVDSQHPHATKEIINNTKLIKNNDPSKWEDIIDKLSSYAEEAKNMIENNNTKNLGQLMNKAHQALKELGVSNNLLDSICEELCSLGALGAKLTGAGQGGCVITLIAKSRLNDFTQTFSKTKTYCYFP